MTGPSRAAYVIRSRKVATPDGYRPAVLLTAPCSTCGVLLDVYPMIVTGHGSGHPHRCWPFGAPLTEQV